MSSASPIPAYIPGAECVANQIKKASFGTFTGEPMSLTYPVIVR